MIDKDLLNRSRNVSNSWTHMISIMIDYNIIKLNEFFIKKLNNSKWDKIINKFINLITYNQATIHSYLATAEIGIIKR